MSWLLWLKDRNLNGVLPGNRKHPAGPHLVKQFHQGKHAWMRELRQDLRGDGILPGACVFLNPDKAIRKALIVKGSFKGWSSAGSCPPWSSSECSSAKADLRSGNSTERLLLLLMPEKYFPERSAFSLLVV